MSKKLICVISGKTTVVTDEYYEKRIKDFQTEDRLKRLYVCRQVKNLLKRGYSQKEIRDILKVSDSVPFVDNSIVEEILKLEEATGFVNTAVHKSDPDVAEFIERIKNYE